MLDDPELQSLFCNPSLKVLSRQEVDAGKFDRHAVHCFIYARTTNENGFYGDDHKAKAMVLLRHDGYLGLPGGFVDKGETLEAALRRELKEEIHFDAKISSDDYLYSTHYLERNWCFHLYALEISSADYVAMERQCVDAIHFGHETMGIMRIPLYIASKGRGLPVFIGHNFCGNAKEEIAYALVATKLVTKQELLRANELSKLSWLAASSTGETK